MKLQCAIDSIPSFVKSQAFYSNRLTRHFILGNILMDFSTLVNSLNRASAFELFRLEGAIQRVLNQPQWIESIRQQLHIGQSIEYFNHIANDLQQAHIIEFRRKHVLIHDIPSKKPWLIPYVSINIDHADIRIREMTREGLGRNEVSVGDIVGFHDRDNRERSGKVIRLNDKTVTILSDSQTWRVSYSLLHRVMNTDFTSAADDSTEFDAVLPRTQRASSVSSTL